MGRGWAPLLQILSVPLPPPSSYRGIEIIIKRMCMTATCLPGRGFCSGLSEGGGTSREAWNQAKKIKSKKAEREVSAKSLWKKAYGAEDNRNYHPCGKNF